MSPVVERVSNLKVIALRTSTGRQSKDSPNMIGKRHQQIYTRNPLLQNLQTPIKSTSTLDKNGLSDDSGSSSSHMQLSNEIDILKEIHNKKVQMMENS